MPRKVLPIRYNECFYCGKRFGSKRVQAKYCSKKCNINKLRDETWIANRHAEERAKILKQTMGYVEVPEFDVWRGYPEEEMRRLGRGVVIRAVRR